MDFERPDEHRLIRETVREFCADEYGGLGGDYLMYALVAEDAVQVLGSYGYTEDFSPQRFYRDAKLMEIGEGTSEIQHAILGDELGL